MPIIIKLEGLPLEASSIDVRKYFLGLSIPDGGVHIVGGEKGVVFIEFSSDEDARQAMARGDGTIINSSIRLLLSSRTEMQTVVEVARQAQQYASLPQQQAPNIQTSNQLNPYLAPSNLPPMGPALLPTSTTTTQLHTPFEGDPRLLSQNYQGILNVINQPQSPKTQPQQPQPQQPQQPSPFVDPRILSQNYQGMLSTLNQAHQQPLLPQQGPIFNQFTPTTLAGNTSLNLGLLQGVNSVVVGAGGGGTLAGPPVNLGNAGNNNATSGNNGNNRNHSPDNRARMSSMRGGDDRLFANKRCVLAASNIPYRATSKDIIEFLSEFNIKEDCIRRRYNQKGQPTADAKIAFPTPDAAMKALKSMNKKNLCGRPVLLKPV